MCAIGSAFGPIIVMIDASRLGHSLATALKDRPHGIPIQPNRSLPLRPPPPIPKKNSPISQGISAQKSPRNRDTNVTENNTKDGDQRNDEMLSLEAVGINFYDSKDEEDNSNDKYVNDFSQKIPKDIVKNRHTKSLDNKRSDDTNRGTKRRNSCEYETISRNGDSCKKRNISNIECDKSGAKAVQKERKKRGSYKKRRKVPSAEENSNLLRKEKSSGGNNINKLKAVSLQNEAKELVSNSQNFENVHSSSLGWPTIFKSRYSDSTSPQLAYINSNLNPTDCIFEKSNWKQTSSNTYKLILPKPPTIPKCPVAIPIDIAHAINQGDSRNPNIINLSTSKNPSFQTIEEIENILPSMPSLEDLMQSDGRQDKLTLHSNQIDCEKSEANLSSELMPIAEARILQSPDDLTSKINNLDAKDLIQLNTTPINDHNINQPHESILNLTTVLEIKIPGRSPELIVLQAPQIMSNGKGDCPADNSPVDPTEQISSSGIQPTHEEPKKIENPIKIDVLSSLRECRKKNRIEHQTKTEEIFQKKDTAEIDHPDKFSLVPDHQQQHEDLSGEDKPQYMLQHQSPIEFEVRIKDTFELPDTEESVQSYEKDKSKIEKSQEITKDSQARPKVEDVVRCRKIRHKLKLKKLYEEEAHLRFRMSQTTDLSRLTRLQQRINCAEKKIENTQKYLKLLSIETPSRIQVRQDLGQKIPSEESVEYELQSSLKLPEQVAKAFSERSSPLSPPIVITISETDSASSGEETDTTDGKSPNDIESNPQSDVEVKSNDTYMSENDPIAASATDHPLPDDKVENTPLNVNPIMTNNNVEYLNKNLPPVSKTISPRVITAPISIPPLIRDPINYSLSDLNAVPSQKSPSVPYSTQNVNLPPDKDNVERKKSNCSCLPCMRSNIAAKIENTAKFAENNLISNAVNDLRTPNTIRRTIIQENTNSHPVPKYPIQENINAHPVPKYPIQENTNVHPVPKYAIQENTNAQPVPNYSIQENTNTHPVPNYPIQENTNTHPVPNYPIQENTNVHPVPNYPVHRADYRTTGNVPSMFSRDNGGANINLSSPLQGHSALPVPPSYYRNLTAQGYSMPSELGPNHQTMQWHNQYAPTKPSMQFTPDQDPPLRSSILAAHLLNSSAQDPANFSSSIKLSSLAQSKDAARNKPAKHVSKRLVTAQFPTLGNWAAQMTRESNVKKSADYSSADRTGYKTTGSDMYKMAATAIDPTNTSNPGNTIHSAPQRPCPEQPRPIPGLPHRSIPRSYQRDYPPNSQFPQNSQNGPLKYPGSEVFMPYPMNRYHQIPTGPQNIRSTEHSNSQSSHVQQNARQYQHPTLQQRPLVPGIHQNQVNSSHLVNSVGMMPQQYPQQPPLYSQAVLSPWYSANNYHKNYVNSQFNGFNGLIKPMDNNSPVYNTTNKNVPPMQPYHDPVTRHLMQQNVPNAKLASPIYNNMTGNLNPVIQDVRNTEPLDLGRSYMTLQSDKVQKSLDRSSNLKCSRCGMPDPKFNCFGCETAFYCNEQCQAQHWNTHLMECPKKMPKLKKVS